MRESDNVRVEEGIQENEEMMKEGGKERCDEVEEVRKDKKRKVQCKQRWRKYERSKYGRAKTGRADDNAKKKGRDKTSEEGKEDEWMTVQKEKKCMERTMSRRERENRYWGGKGEKERKRRVSDSLSSSARNCCPEIRRTIRSCQDQHTHKHTRRACTRSRYGTSQSTKDSHAHKRSVCATVLGFVSEVSVSST